MVASARSPWPFLLSQLRRSDRPGFGRAELDAAGLDPAELLSARLIEREGGGGTWHPPGCQNGCLPHLDFETRCAERLVGVACPEEPPCWLGFEWHPAVDLERYSCSAGRVFDALRAANGLEPLAVPPRSGVVPVGTLDRSGKRVPVVWMRCAMGAFEPTCRGLRTTLGGDALVVLLSRPPGTTPALLDGGVVLLDVPLDDAGDCRLGRALDLIDPADRTAMGSRSPAPVPGTACPGPAANVFRCDGDVWTLTFAGRTVCLANSKGLAYLSRLLQNPRTILPAAELHAVTAGKTVRLQAGSAGEVADDEALQGYAEALQDLDGDLAEAREDNDLSRVASLERERAELLAHVREATGARGRKRKVADDANRLRNAISMAIARALANMTSHPELQRHLKESVQMGGSFAYVPPKPTSWAA